MPKYYTGRKTKYLFDPKSKFPYIGDDRWIEGTILDIHKCLMSDMIPVSNQG
jgi:hypothetical protein